MPEYKHWRTKPGTGKETSITIHLEKELPRLKKKTSTPIKKTHTTLVYPLDLQAQSFYPESIKFTPYKRESTSLEKVMKATSEAWKSFGRLTSDKIGGSDTGICTKAEQEAYDASQTLKKGTDDSGTMMRSLETVMDYVSKQTYAGEIYEFGRRVLSEATSGVRPSNINDSNGLILDPVIYLNMPNEITFAEPVAWDGTDLNTIGAIAKSPSSLEAGTIANIGNMVGGGAGMLAGMFTKHSKGILAGLGPISGFLLGSLGGNTIQKMFESSFANIANPYKEMTFTGIGFREFAFNFVFRARSEDEVKVVQDIIEAFRYHSKPKTSYGGSVLNYPDEFLIEFLTKPQVKKDKSTQDRFITNPYVPQLKMCVCKGVNTNFTSQNTWRTLKNGHPVEISLALTFEETELVTAEDVIGETAFGRFKNSGRSF